MDIFSEKNRKLTLEELQSVTLHGKPVYVCEASGQCPKRYALVTRTMKGQVCFYYVNEQMRKPDCHSNLMELWLDSGMPFQIYLRDPKKYPAEE